MTRHTYVALKSHGPFTLFQREDNRQVIVRLVNHQVQAVMRGHLPRGGGTWVASGTDAGIDYITCGKAYAPSTCRKLWRELTKSCGFCNSKEN